MPVLFCSFSFQEENHVLAVDNEMANRMSLFYAQATPMLKVLSDATTKFVSDVSIQNLMGIILRRSMTRLNWAKEFHFCHNSLLK